jgi:hypothetical protein
MQLCDLEHYVFAYFLTTDALHVNVDGRFYRRHEFVHIFEDRLFHATQQWGPGVAGRHPAIANGLVDKLIELKALSTSSDQLSGIFHQFNTSRYRAVINELIQANDICRHSQQGSSHFWTEAFATVSTGKKSDS